MRRAESDSVTQALPGWEKILRSPILRLFLILLASYGLFFFSYKYYVPIRADFYRYYPMYERPLDFTAASAPFVYRQVSAVVTHLL